MDMIITKLSEHNKSWLLDDEGQATTYYDFPEECIENYLHISAVWDSQWLYTNSKDSNIEENVIIYLVQCCVYQYNSKKFCEHEVGLMEYAKFFISPLDVRVHSAFFTELYAFIESKKYNWSEEEVLSEGTHIIDYMCAKYAYIHYDNDYKNIFVKTPIYNNRWKKVIKSFLKHNFKHIDTISIIDYCENKNHTEFIEE